MFGIGPQELLLILVIALIVVGPRKLPEIGRSLGKGLREVRKAQDEVRKTIQVNLDEEPATPSRARTGITAQTPSDESATGESPSAPEAAAAAASQPVAEVSKTLGRGLAELRKARQEIERSFRVDLDETGRAPRPSAPGSTDRSRPEPGGQQPGPAAGDPPAE
jgi:TatA/E family protein of Tat protein translocase